MQGMHRIIVTVLRRAKLTENVNLGEAIFLYTPLLSWGIFVLVLYRHDLSRLFHPIRENWSMRNWWDVSNHLGLVDPEKATRRPGRSTWGFASSPSSGLYSSLC